MPGIKLVYYWSIVLLINTAIHVSTNFRVKKRAELKLNPYMQISWDLLGKSCNFYISSNPCDFRGSDKTF